MSETQIETESNTVSSEDKIDIKLGDVYANVVYSVDRDETLTEATKSFATSYGKVIGKSVSAKKAGSYDPDKVEIIIGKVKYPECDEIYKDITYSDVKVCVVGKKLIIAGYNTALMAEVLEDLAKEIGKNKDSDGNISLGEDFVIEKTYAEPLSAVPVLSGGKPTIIDTGDNCYMLNFGAIKKEVFTKYCEDIVANGLTLYAEKTIDNNIYNTYVNGEYVATAIYTNYNSIAKVLVEPLSETALPTKEADNVYTSVSGVETTITQVGLYDGDPARTYNGMSYVIRLNDGSFIVVDGGFERNGYAERLYNVLKKQAVDPDNIVIAAWVISHAHDDHVDVFESFFETYGDKLTIERFICNLPAVEQLKDNWANEREGNERYTTMMRDFLNTSFPNIPIVKAHPGQEFYIRNAKINILFTVDVYDKKLDDFNNTSVVFKLETEGKSMIFLGDYDDKGETIPKLYRTPTLLSDIMQVAHHGLPENSSNAMASIIKPTYVFWPTGAQVVKTGTEKYPDGLDLFTVEQNQWILTKCNKDNIYLAEDNVYVFTVKTCSVVKYETVAEYLAS